MGDVKDLSINDLDLDDSLALDSDDLSLDIDVGDISNLSLLSFDDNDNLDFDLDAGSELFIDFSETQDSMIDASVLLSTQFDMSKELTSLYQLTNEAWKKVSSINANIKVEFSHPNYTEFSFIANESTRQQVYKFFCIMVEDLVTLKEYVNLDLESAYKELVERMYDEIHFTTNIYDAKIKKIFDVFYDKNKKIVNAVQINTNENIAKLLDADRLRRSNIFYYINSVPWNVVTKFLGDINNLRQDIQVNPKDYGFFVNNIKESTRARKITFRDIFEGINIFLTSDETLELLHLSADKRAEFTIGELLRRYVVMELQDGLFFPPGISTLADNSYSDKLVNQVYNSLLDAMYNGSLIAEVLALLMDMMFGSRSIKNVEEDYTAPFIVSLAVYLSNFVKDSSMTNPSFYFNISLNNEDDTKLKYSLSYEFNEQSHIINTEDILCDCVGDKQSIYPVPFIYEIEDKSLMICPHPDIVRGIRGIKSGGKTYINSNFCYKYVPSFSWLTSINMTSGSNKNIDDINEDFIGKDNDPLLEEILNYDNVFDNSGPEPKIINIISEDSNYNIIAMQVGNSDKIDVLHILDDSKQIRFDTSTGVFDEDSSLIIRYILQDSKEEQVIILDYGEYKIVSDSNSEIDSNSVFNEIKVIIPELEEHYIDNMYSYLNIINKELCDREAIDYSEELSEVRRIVTRDLGFYLQLNFIDQPLGRLAINKFKDLYLNNLNLSSFNIELLEDVLTIISGVPNELTTIKEPSKELIEDILNKYSYDGSGFNFYFSKLFEEDLHVLALHGCSKSEVASGMSEEVYEAVMGIPQVHKRLRELEEQMILIRILFRIDSNILSTLKKNTAFTSAYKNVCTLETVQKIENNLKSYFKDKQSNECLSVTKKVLQSTYLNNYIIIKYFVLCRDLYSIISELEECFSQGDETFLGLYNNIVKSLGISSSKEITREDFEKNIDRGIIQDIFLENNSLFRDIVHVGIIREVGNLMDINVLKVYDMLVKYGKHLFLNSSGTHKYGIEDLFDVSEFINKLYSYIGSYFITYCPLIGEAPNDIDGGYDRYSTYLQHKSDYISPVILSNFEKYKLRDLSYLFETSGSDILDDMDVGNK